MRPTLRNTTHALDCALGFGSMQAKAQSTAILLDGRLDDWSPVLATFTDGDAPSTGIDLLSMQVTNDDAYLFIKLTVGSEVDLSALASSVLFAKSSSSP